MPGVLTQPRRATLTDSQQLNVIASTIAAGWVVASVFALVVGFPTVMKFYALGLHPESEGPFLVHLFAYSFFHNVVILVMSLVSLVGAVRCAKGYLTPPAFVRLYSLGTVVTGLVFLLVSAKAGLRQPLIGAGGPILALFGAMAVLNPSQRVALFFFVPMRLPWAVVCVGVLQLLAVASEPNFAVGMIAGLIAGVMYGAVERMFRTWTLGARAAERSW